MRKFLLVSVLAFSLSGCATTPGGGIDLAAFYKQVQTYVIGACRFEPSVLSIASVVASFFPGGTVITGGVQAVGDAICASFKSSTFAAAPVSGRSVTTVVKTPRGNVVVTGKAK